jgi:Holliday junction resolvase|tara:strand:+ start:2113 stop:2424 length:312 start_codon:yes stop_codon:yes gene_type:complete
MDKTWKKFERWVAEFLTELGDDADRVPVTGRTRGSAPDVTSNTLSIECKYRKKIPEWIKDAMRQAVASSRNGTVPVVFIKENGTAFDDTLIVFRAKDFREKLK